MNTTTRNLEGWPTFRLLRRLQEAVQYEVRLIYVKTQEAETWGY
jgi:hypothetical protein